MSVYNKAKDRDHKGRLTSKYRREKWNWNTPSWWHRMHTTVPNRRKEKKLCQRSLNICNYSEHELMWLVSRRPTEYYW